MVNAALQHCIDVGFGVPARSVCIVPGNLIPFFDEDNLEYALKGYRIVSFGSIVI